MNTFTGEDLVLVSPRYLAGAGTRIADALGPLIHLFDWSYDHDPASGHIRLDSPCGSAFLDFEPTRFDGTWWTIRHHDPSWTARFSRQTPIEAIAAVAQALPQLLGDARHADRIPLTTRGLDQTAALNGWTTTRTVATTVYTSPDGHCVLTHEPDSELPWRFAHSLYDGFDTEWTATISCDAPEELARQFFAHLADPAPVERFFKDLPYLVQTSSGALITPVNTASVSPYVHHAAAQAARTPAGRPQRR
ncbi:DUF317 domain-containing protein [Streptomyces achromogenes]|uniref:DUF317 domain-containing protein n=1 Tax=Streptomyces achromogenes TaxID=67255 RepID=UPI0037D3BCB5